jgi:succinyl-diaminopimelate desuccinylase
MASASESLSDQLVNLTRDLVNIASPSLAETAISDWVEATLRNVPALQVTRIGDNVIAQTVGGNDNRVVFGGHLDTVPANANEVADLRAGQLWGVGTTDMKSGVAVMLALAERAESWPVPTTYVFYVAEEIAREHNGLLAVERARPDLLAGSCAILGEPTNNVVEAGCQGVVLAQVTIRGERAHTARPWMGRNAIQRAAPLLALIDSYVARQPLVDGCEYREAVQVVAITGGVANNVVPDECVIRINHRFAPDRTVSDAYAWLSDWIGTAIGPDDAVQLIESAPAAHPGLHAGPLGKLVAVSGAAPQAKLGWTDVAFFAERGVAACNFGPGDPLLAHTRDERVDVTRIVDCYGVLESWLQSL